MTNIENRCEILPIFRAGAWWWPFPLPFNWQLLTACFGWAPDLHGQRCRINSWLFISIGTWSPLKYPLPFCCTCGAIAFVLLLSIWTGFFSGDGVLFDRTICIGIWIGSVGFGGFWRGGMGGNGFWYVGGGTVGWLDWMRVSTLGKFILCWIPSAAKSSSTVRKGFNDVGLITGWITSVSIPGNGTELVGNGNCSSCNDIWFAFSQHSMIDFSSVCCCKIGFVLMNFNNRMK